MIKAEFWGGPWHGQTRWIPDSPNFIAVLMPSFAVHKPPHEILNYEHYLALPGRAVYFYHDALSEPMLTYMRASRQPFAVGYFAWCETSYVLSIRRNLTLQIQLKAASSAFAEKINGIAARRIYARAKRRPKSA